ncbi:MAG: tryptophan 2,3-dioxygenase family protein, partial [Pseudonocardia sp.]|nr:tryptophan 2,3-dioxygenase family protein [Pseudonocardia sp.]
LHLDQVLSAQHPLSDAHDEMLFIIQHQTSELWMRLALHELGAAREAIAADRLRLAFKMLTRVARIFEQLNNAWDVLRTVPAGAPVTYTEYAAKSGRPAAVRAAASACARNAAALFVPCHRVLRSDGTLGGFRWGVDVKRKLLAHESTH